MTGVKVERTARGNVKIVLDQTSALNLSSIMNWSLVANTGGTDEDALEAQECAEAAVEELSWALWRALIAAGVDYEDL